MRRIIKRRPRRVGLPPGTLVHIGERKAEKVRIRIIDYDGERFEEMEAKTVEESFPFRDKPTLTWINVDGIHDPEIIEKLGKHFAAHPLILEDILDTEQRPKMEDFEEYIFVVLKMVSYDAKKNEIESEQVSIIVGSNYVISFQEKEGDVFDPVRERIRNGKGRIRKMGADYLAYALMDAIVDNYFVILETFGEKIGIVEEELVSDPTQKTSQSIHALKGNMVSLRKSIWPLREVISRLERGESPLIKEATGIYFRDVYDHTIQVIDSIETFRDMLSGMFDMYLSSISNKMNEVMKVLTIIATIFIPLTFIAGVYGMNFKYMPELGWRWGYPAIWAVIVIVAVLMFVNFKRRKWL